MAKSIATQDGNIELSYHKKTNTQTLSIKSPLYQTNILTEARAILSKGVYRTVKFIVKHIQDMNYELSEIKNSGGDLQMIIPEKTIKEWYTDEHRHRELKAAANWLSNTTVEYKVGDNGWGFAALVSNIEYDPNIGLTVKIDNKVLPLYNVSREKNFTLLDFTATMNIQSRPASFFYDKCCKWRSTGIFYYTPEDLCVALGIQKNVTKLRTRYILPAEEEIAKLFQQSKVDFYFESFMVRSEVGKGGSVERFVFRIFKCFPDSSMDKAERSSQREEICAIIKKIVPSMYHDGILHQLGELSRYELFDLWKDMKKFDTNVKDNKIEDIRGFLWILLRNYYSIDPKGDVRFHNMKDSRYPKYKKIGPQFVEIVGKDVIKTQEQEFAQRRAENNDWYQYWRDAVNYICENLSNDDRPISDSERLLVSTLFNDPGNIVPDYNGTVLNVKFKESIYKYNFVEPYAPFLHGLKSLLQKAILAYFPKIEMLIYSVFEDRREVSKEIIYPELPGEQ